MIGRLLLCIVTLAMAMAVLKMVFVGIVLATIGVIIFGLIFRTQETVGFLITCGVLSFIGNHPAIAFGLIVLACLIAFIRYLMNTEPIGGGDTALLTGRADRERS